MPDQGSLNPIQRAPVPENVKVTEFTSVSRAVPPELFELELTNQSPLNRTAALFSSTRFQGPGPPVPTEAFTFNVDIAVCVKAPLDPVIASANAPVWALPVVETVSVDEPDPLILAGLKLVLAPDPKPEALKETAPENPLLPVTVTV
jgi:hypothetical protein